MSLYSWLFIHISSVADNGDCDVADGEMEIEEVPLVSHQDVEERTTTATESSSREHNSVKRTRLRLLLTKGSVFTVGILVLIIGAILAGVFPHGGRLESDCIVNNTCYCDIESLIPEPNSTMLTASFMYQTSMMGVSTQSTRYQSSSLHQILPTPTPV